MFKKIIEENLLKDAEAEYAVPFGQRVGKYLVVGLASLAASYVAESLYDRYMANKKEINNAEA